MPSTPAAVGSDRVGVRLSPVTPFNDLRDANPQETFEYVVDQLNRFGVPWVPLIAATRSFSFKSFKT